MCVPSEKDLIRSVSVSWPPHDLVFAGLFPGLVPLFSDPFYLLITLKLDAPRAAQDVGAVIRMIPHEVERFVRIEPFFNCGFFPAVEPGVEVTGQEVRHLHNLAHGQTKDITYKQHTFCVSEVGTGWAWWLGGSFQTFYDGGFISKKCIMRDGRGIISLAFFALFLYHLFQFFELFFRNFAIFLQFLKFGLSTPTVGY